MTQDVLSPSKDVRAGGNHRASCQFTHTPEPKAIQKPSKGPLCSGEEILLWGSLQRGQPGACSLQRSADQLVTQPVSVAWLSYRSLEAVFNLHSWLRAGESLGIQSPLGTLLLAPSHVALAQ